MANLLQATLKVAGGICLSNKLAPERAVTSQLATLALNGCCFFFSGKHLNHLPGITFCLAITRTLPSSQLNKKALASTRW